MPTVSNVNEFQRTKTLAEKNQAKVIDIMKVPTIHRMLGDDGELG